MRKGEKPVDEFDVPGDAAPDDRHDPVRRDPPWPKGHRPATPCEEELWHSFEDLRVDEASHLTQQAVAERIGRSRTSISIGEEGYALLRDAIKDEVSRRRRVRRRAAASAPAGAALPTAEEREAARLERREKTIAHFKGIAQRADTALVAANVRAVRAEEALARCKGLLAGVFRDFKAGRWVRAEGGGDALVDLEAFLSEAGMSIGGAAPGGVGAPLGGGTKEVAVITGLRGVAASGKPWRTRR